jgi:glycosyltransferase involved in cell wall biosynthesis
MILPMSQPRLSVIVPTYNRAPVLEHCLEALAAQDCEPGAFEIIVSDDGSGDATRATAERYGARGKPAVRYLHQENAGANRARNRAVAAAAAPLLLFINDDTIATPGMIGSHLATHARHPDERVAVLGRVTVSPDIPASRLAPLHLDYAFAQLGARTELDWRAFYTCNVSVKKSLLERGGLFEERVRYHEDLELAERLSHHGLRVVYNPEALGYHEHFLTEREFLEIAQREAKALVAWSRIAPRVEPLLGELGFEPALPAGRRIRNQVSDLAVNRVTIPLWMWVARHVPGDGVALRIYGKVYQSERRSSLRRWLREPAAA